MPLHWPHLPATAQTLPVSTEQQATTVSPQIHQFGASFHVVNSPTPHYELEHGGVTYGDTKLTAEHIEYYAKAEVPGLATPGMAAGTILADGSVAVTDPIGTLHAGRIRFSTVTHSGFADDIALEVEGLSIKADHLQIEPETWTLTGATVREARGFGKASFHANQAVIRLGDKITIYRPRLSIAGHSIGLGEASFSLSQGFSAGIYPTPAYDSVNGFGVHWQPAFRLANDLALNGSFGSNQKTLPGYSFHLTRTFGPDNERDGLVVSGTDLDRRFGGAYFDTVSVKSPEEERQRLARPRSSLSLGSDYNYQVLDRLGSEEFARPFEATYQQSLKLPAGFLAEIHTAYQNLRLIGESNQSRWYGQGLVDAPLIELGPNLAAHIRFEGLTYQGSNENFSWVRSETGLVYRAATNIRFGAAAVVAEEIGTPLFQVDRLYSKNGFLLRSDLGLGPRQLSTIFAIDGRSGRFYDTEIMVSQAMGPIRGYMIWRSFPGEFILGVEFRPESIFNVLAKRSPGTKVKSPADPFN